jgi:ribosome-associated translation inhibitor RaiA
MRISILDRQNELSRNLRENVERRLVFALSRFSSRIERVSVSFDDTNGPRGGLDKSCTIVVQLRKLGTVRVNHVDTQIGVGLSHAVDRIRRAVARTIDRGRQQRRRVSTGTASLDASEALDSPSASEVAFD